MSPKQETSRQTVISIGKTSSGDGNDYVTITIGQRSEIKLEMSVEDFALALFGLADRPATIRERGPRPPGAHP